MYTLPGYVVSVGYVVSSLRQQTPLIFFKLLHY